MEKGEIDLDHLVGVQCPYRENTLCAKEDSLAPCGLTQCRGPGCFRGKRRRVGAAAQGIRTLRSAGTAPSARTPPPSPIPGLIAKLPVTVNNLDRDQTYRVPGIRDCIPGRPQNLRLRGFPDFSSPVCGPTGTNKGTSDLVMTGCCERQISDFRVADLANSRAIPCDQRLEFEHFAPQLIPPMTKSEIH